MATSSTNQTADHTLYPDLEAAGERVRQANDRFLEAGRKVTTAYLDGLERYFQGVAQFERKISEQIQVEPLAGVFSAHAKMTEDLATAGISAARDVVAG